MTPPMDKSVYCQAGKRLKRMSAISPVRRSPLQPRTLRSFQTYRHLGRTEYDERMNKAINKEMDQVLDEIIQGVLERRKELNKSLNELPMCEVLGERPHADRWTCASCIARPCPY